MKLLFFIDGMIAGGKERRLLELMKGIAARKDIEIELVVMNKEIHYQEVFELGIKIHYLIRSQKKDISVFLKFYQICKNYRPDLVHCWDSMTALYSIPACKLLRIKYVNGMIVDSPSKRSIFNKYWLRAKLSFMFSDIIIANSKAGLLAYGSPVKKSYFVYNGFNFSRANNLSNKEIVLKEWGINTKYIVGMVASYSKYKDYATYFTAAQNILKKRSDITFFAIGSDTDSEKAKAHIDGKYINHFRLLGKRTDVESLVNILDLGVLSTFTEGISNSIMEYMALGKPVIASYGGGTNEIVQQNKTGILIKQSDPIELADKIEYLLNNPELSRKYGLVGLERIKTVFSINNMVSEYIKLYEKVSKN